MPIYEYELLEGKCDKCPGRFETRQRINDPSLTECPKCGKSVQRLISRVAIHTPLTTSRLRETGMTRLRRLDHGLYEADGAESGILDMTNEMEQDSADPEDDVPIYDLSGELEDHQPASKEVESDSSDSMDESFAPRGRRRKRKKTVKLPFYDLIAADHQD
ncbi:MAG: hypothetical protein B6244_07290 [Candidatus Cloacimonetes bacterium 4572_55]|nr:MAG: hypothetical protein B6244_07290 [Candidatus Cloacimonetes bacterium 4572_55]